MNNKVYSTILTLLALSTHLGAMKKTSAQITRVRVVPLQLKKDTQEWYVLLGQDKDTFFGDFYKNVKNETPGQAAIKALTNQTNSIYSEKNFSIGKAQTVSLPSGDALYFVEVPFITGTELAKKGTSLQFKSDFTWVPVKQILKASHGLTPKNKKKPIRKKVFELLKQHLPGATRALLQAKMVKKAPAPTKIIVKPPPPKKLAVSREVSKKPYTTLVEFIFDEKPHQPSKEESYKITPDFEVYVDKLLVKSFWINYSDLKNEDGSPLTAPQKKEILEYLKHNEHHVSDTTFRLANNNHNVLGPGKDTKHKNTVWKYVHRYMRQLPGLMKALKKK